ncbi:DUF58 domain-containing protein [Alkalicoccobacillus gibsonii]|uniref:DUF58 domain-containing protein n=1 Tax=Alkalicoccobacillus gibsonii TaxID=79881 RepID=UPI0019349C64|nr:DUF58 domain-containing protein [Alkalicoccobacillus gibsonii]MBM0067565.1 DUF58 domain-containing protein [Alkalicoccobacillus gibsonii]
MRKRRLFIQTFLKGLAGVLVVGGSFAYAMFQGGFVSWFLFYSVMIVGLVMTISILIPATFTPSRTLGRSTCYSGEAVEVTITVKKHRFQPFMYLTVEDVVPSHLGQATDTRAMFFFTAARTLTFTYRLSSLKRGSYVFHDIHLTSSDFFGWFERKQKIRVETEFVVYPRYYQLGDVQAFQTPNHSNGVSATSSFKDEERSLAGVRSYVPGDRLTSINWKQSARRKELMTKEFETYEGKRTIIAFDPYRSTVKPEQFEDVVEQVASIASTFIQANVESQLAAFHKNQHWITEELQAFTWEKVLRMLASIQANQQPAPIIHPIYRQWTNQTVIYICAELDQQVIHTIERLALEGIEVKVCLLEFEPDQISLAEQLRIKGIEPIYMTS